MLKLLDHFASTRNTLETMALEDQTGTTLCFDQIDMNVHHIFVSLSTQLLRMVTSTPVQFRVYIFFEGHYFLLRAQSIITEFTNILLGDNLSFRSGRSCAVFNILSQVLNKYICISNAQKVLASRLNISLFRIYLKV